MKDERVFDLNISNSFERTVQYHEGGEIWQRCSCQCSNGNVTNSVIKSRSTNLPTKRLRHLTRNIQYKLWRKLVNLYTSCPVILPPVHSFSHSPHPFTLGISFGLRFSFLMVLSSMFYLCSPSFWHEKIVLVYSFLWNLWVGVFQLSPKLQNVLFYSLLHYSTKTMFGLNTPGTI